MSGITMIKNKILLTHHIEVKKQFCQYFRKTHLDKIISLMI